MQQLLCRYGALCIVCSVAMVEEPILLFLPATDHPSATVCLLREASAEAPASLPSSVLPPGRVGSVCFGTYPVALGVGRRVCSSWEGALLPNRATLVEQVGPESRDHLDEPPPHQCAHQHVLHDGTSQAHVHGQDGSDETRLGNASGHLLASGLGR